MTQDEFDEMVVGQVISDRNSNRIIYKTGVDQFKLIDNSQYPIVTHAGDSRLMMSMTGGSAGALGNWYGSLRPISYGPSLTVEELTELSNLQRERDNFVKHKRLSKFKLMPATIRQSIVDEGYLDDLIKDFDNANDSDFPDAARLSELKRKQDAANGGYMSATSLSAIYSNDHIEITTRKYWAIRKHFTTEELAKAHAEACLEENIR